MLRKLLTPALLASALITQPVAAQQMPEMSEEEVAAFVRVALPGAFRSIQTKCRTSLDGNAYIYASGDELHALFAAASRDAWPGAAQMIARSASRDNPAMGEVLAGMPPEVLQPFLDEMVAGMVTSRVEEKHCSQINRAMELLDPLPPENLAALIGLAYAESQKGRDGEQAAGTGVSSR